jgi:hypothetical protein
MNRRRCSPLRFAIATLPLGSPGTKAMPDGGAPTGLWFRRMFWLLLIGLAHAYLIWDGDILVPYALCGILLLWWVRRLPAWALMAASIALLTIGALLGVGVREERSGRRLGGDLAGDHDELPLCERRCHSEVLLDQEEAHALCHERLARADEALDDRRREPLRGLVHHE